jgi:hypothetical protein
MVAYNSSQHSTRFKRILEADLVSGYWFPLDKEGCLSSVYIMSGVSVPTGGIWEIELPWQIYALGKSFR